MNEESQPKKLYIKRLSGLWVNLALVLFTLAFASIVRADSGLADSPWPMFHGDSKLTGQSNADTSKVDGTVKWQFKTEDQIETSPVIGADGTIYVADQNCNLYAIDSKGKEKWKIKLGEAITSIEWGYHSCFQSSPAIAKDGTIYAFPMSGNFYAINYDGTEKWKTPIFTFKNDWSSPSIAPDGTIYFGSELYPPQETGKPQEKTANVYALNPDGTVKWNYDTKGVWVTSTSSIADDGTMYTSANDCIENGCENTIFAFTPEGNIKWKYPIKNGVNEGSVAIGSDGTIYFDAKGKDNPKVNAFFYALNPDGKEKWKYSVPDGVSMTPGLSKDGKIYFGDWNGVFYALDLNGKLLWKAETPPAYEALSSSPAIGNEGTIYFGTIAKYFYAYNPDGTKKWEIGLEEGGVNSSPAIGSDGTVYFASVHGTLYAVGSKNDATATSSPRDSGGNLPIIIGAIVGFIALVAIILINIYFRRKQKNRLAIYLSVGIIILAVLIYLALGMIFGDDQNKTSNQNQNNQLNKTNQQNSNQESKNADCPHHVYGTKETSWYGAYGMETKDLTNEEVEKIRKDCPNATFQAEVR